MSLSVSLKKDFHQLHCTTSSFVPPGEDWCLRMCRSFQVMDHSWPMGSVKLVAITWYHQDIFSCVTCCNMLSWPKKVQRLLSTSQMMRAGADAKVFANWCSWEPSFLTGAEALTIRAVICPCTREYSHLQLISYGFPHCLSSRASDRWWVPKGATAPHGEETTDEPISWPWDLTRFLQAPWSQLRHMGTSCRSAVSDPWRNRSTSSFSLPSPFFCLQAHAVTSYFGYSATPVFFTMSFPRKYMVLLSWILDTKVWLS